MESLQKLNREQLTELFDLLMANKFIGVADDVYLEITNRGW
jgi:aspartate/methionine/tyrosine aminotransferase